MDIVQAHGNWLQSQGKNTIKLNELLMTPALKVGDPVWFFNGEWHEGSVWRIEEFKDLYGKLYDFTYLISSPALDSDSFKNITVRRNVGELRLGKRPE